MIKQQNIFKEDRPINLEEEEVLDQQPKESSFVQPTPQPIEQPTQPIILSEGQQFNAGLVNFKNRVINLNSKQPKSDASALRNAGQSIIQGTNEQQRQPIQKQDASQMHPNQNDAFVTRHNQTYLVPPPILEQKSKDIIERERKALRDKGSKACQIF